MIRLPCERSPIDGYTKFSLGLSQILVDRGKTYGSPSFVNLSGISDRSKQSLTIPKGDLGSINLLSFFGQSDFILEQR